MQCLSRAPCAARFCDYSAQAARMPSEVYHTCNNQSSIIPRLSAEVIESDNRNIAVTGRARVSLHLGVLIEYLQ